MTQFHEHALHGVGPRRLPSANDHHEVMARGKLVLPSSEGLANPSLPAAPYDSRTDAT
jgi:hypothetical protein